MTFIDEGLVVKNIAPLLVLSWFAAIGSSGCADDGLESMPAHCTANGTWSLSATGRAFIVSELSAERAEVTITSIDGCGFDMSIGAETVSVSCTAPDLSLPVIVGETYTLDACLTRRSFSGGHSFLVLRDRAGELVLAGGTGIELVEEVPCLPEELEISKVYDDACPPFEDASVCGHRQNFGVRFAHESQVVDLWSGDVGELLIGGSPYTVNNYYSFKVPDSESNNCQDDWDQHMSWAIVRKNQ